MEDKPLLGDSGTKRPVILYIIIGVLVIVVIVLSIVLATKKTDCDCPSANQTPSGPETPDTPDTPVTPSPYDQNHFINVTESYYTNKPGGSRELQGSLNHFDSPYFKMVDVYNMKSNGNRTILSNFKTYQQTSEYSSHCSAIIMVQNYYGDSEISERKCMLDIGFTDLDTKEPSDDDYKKLNMKSIEEYINTLGYTTTSNENFTEENFPFDYTLSFSNFAREVLQKNETMLVMWGDWGATTSVVIGVDTMGNETRAEDHVIILADTYDTCDHLNDGYYIIGLDKFYYNWIYNKIYYLTDEKLQTKRFIIVHRKTGN